MKVKFLSVLLVLAMILSMAIPTVYAEEADRIDEAQTITEETVGETTEETAGEAIEEIAGEAIEEIAGEATEEIAGETTEETSDETTEMAVAADISAEEQTYTGTYEKVAGKDLASVRYYLADATDYAFATVTETDAGYSYTFTAPAGEYTVVPEYYSTTVWDGAVDISWYDPAQSAFYLSNGAQLAGLSAIVSGHLDSNTADYRVKGDLSLLKYHQVDNFAMTAGNDGSGGYTVYMGEAENSFLGKTIYLTADIDMGGKTQYTNWMPIGGYYLQDNTVDMASEPYHIIVSYFQGSMDGQGHRITNLYCDRYSKGDYCGSQGIGFIGYIGGYYEDETVGELFVRNLSVSGTVYGRRMVGGIIGRMGDAASAIYVENCANHVNVTGTDSKGQGGIVGAGWANAGAIINCYNTGSVINDTYTGYAGGISGNNNLNIINCYNVGTIRVTGNRGRAIGTHSSGNYLIEDCFYLEGCDNAPADAGYYKGGYNGTANIVAYDETFMKSLDFVSYLNTNGTAFVYNEGGYPQLLWEAGKTGTANVTIEQPQGGTIIANRTGSVPYGTVLHLSNTESTGWAFRTYTVNSKVADTGFYTVSEENTVVSGTFESLAAGVLNIEYSDAAVLTVIKDGTALVDGVPTAVTEYPVNTGDPLYEGDILYVSAEWREGAYPTDPNLVYKGMNGMSSAYKYSFTYTGGNDKFSTTAKHTVTADISNEGVTLTLKVEAQTTNKTWTDNGVYDISWYEGHENDAEYTLTNAHQLAGVAYLVTNKLEDFRGQTIKLGADINLANDDGTTGVRNWPGMSGTSTTFKADNEDGTYEINNQFRGTFDGCGYMIYNMTATQSGSYGGLFRATYGATIKNLTVSGTATSSSGTGGIVAYGYSTTVSNCRSYVDVKSTGTLGPEGGIVAYVRNGCVIENCINYGTVVSAGKGGGIVGTGYSSSEGDVTITDCINYGDVGGMTNRSSGGIGGIIGDLKQLCTITRCANYGDIYSGNWFVGGIAGLMTGGSTEEKACIVTDSYNVGKVTSCTTYKNGAVGGLAGRLTYAKITNCYNYGTITETDDCTASYHGALIGNDQAKDITGISNTHYLDTCFPYTVTETDEAGNVTTSSGYYGSGIELTTSTNVAAKTAAEFASAEFLTTLNANNCYTLAENAAYPELIGAAGSVHTHSGGDATCNVQAVCDSCHMPYGEFDADDHTGNLTEIRNASDPLWTTDGYSGDVCCVGCDAVLEAGSVIPVDLTEVVLTVNEADAKGRILSTKSYTASDLNELNAKCNVGTQAYQYWQTDSATGEVVTRFLAATQYVTFDALFADAGITFASGDSMLVNNDRTVTWETIDAAKWYYKTVETTDEEGNTTTSIQEVAVAPAIAFCSETGAEPQTVEEIAEAAKISGVLRLCYGSEAYGTAASAGARLYSGVNTITIQHPTAVDIMGDANGDGEVDNVDAMLILQYSVGLIDADKLDLTVCDVNGDRLYDNVDAMRILQFAVGLIESF